MTELKNKNNNSPSGISSLKEELHHVFVIKTGGNVIDDPVALASFLKDFAAIEERKILVHGGGKIATKIGDRLGIESKYINGRRITDEATMDLVTMVYGGLVNKKIVAQLQAFGCNAIGLTGADANLIPAVKRPVTDIDYGFAGDVDNGRLSRSGVTSCQLLLENGLVPVIAPLTHDGEGQMLNTNADTIAAALAVALSKHYTVRLIYCFEKKGVLRNIRDEDDVIHDMDDKVYQELLAAGALDDGILPKLENAFDAIRQGVKNVLIGHAADLLQNTGNQVNGTLIR